MPENHDEKARYFFGSRPLDHSVSGFVAGSVASASLTPFDLLKLRMQVQGQGHSLGTTKQNVVYRNTIHAARSIVKNEGMLAIYKGMGPNVLGNACAWGTYFLCYTKFKQVMLQRKRRLGDSQETLGPIEHISAGAFSGALVLTMTNPIWVIKTQIMLDSKPYEGLFPRTSLKGKILELWRSEGLMGLYRGYVPGLIGVSHGAIQFGAYEYIKKLAFRYKGLTEGGSDKGRLQSKEYAFLAALSKTVATAATYPYQVVRSRLQDPASTYENAWQCLRKTIKFEGVRGLYRGLCINLVKVMPNACVVFLVYEETQHFLASQARKRAARES